MIVYQAAVPTYYGAFMLTKATIMFILIGAVLFALNTKLEHPFSTDFSDMLFVFIAHIVIFGFICGNFSGSFIGLEVVSVGFHLIWLFTNLVKCAVQR